MTLAMTVAMTVRSLCTAAVLGAALVVGTGPAVEAREDILASAQGHELSRQRVTAAIAFLEFLAGGAFSSEERDAILKEARSDFLRDPVGQQRAYASIEDAARRLASFHGDKINEAQLCEETTAAIHLDLLSRPAKERDTAAITALFRRVEVIAADPASRHVVTRRGLEALLDANDFVAGLAGHRALDAAAREKAIADVAAAFPSMSAADQDVLAHGSSRWAWLQAYWSGLAAGDRAAVAAELKRKVARADAVPVAARELETKARLALISARVDRNVRAILGVQAGSAVLGVMGSQSRSFGK